MIFPLPPGHAFGHNAYSAQMHDGTVGMDTVHITQWQKHYSLHWDKELTPSGRYDGPTQRAAHAVQRRYGLPLTGAVDEATWDGCFNGPESTQSAEPAPAEDVPTPAPIPAAETYVDRLRRREAKSQANKIAWRHRDQGDAPAWWTAPIGPGSPADDVRKVRSTLGFPPSSNYAATVTSRVKGVQRAAGLTPTGVVDQVTAWLLEEMVPAA